jgi:hypothetical protein
MNKNRVLISLVAIIPFLPNAFGDAHDAGLIARPFPGLAWTVEALPLNQRTTPPGDSEAAHTKPPLDPDSLYVEVINEMGEGFLKQQIQTRKDHFLVRYVVGRLLVLWDHEKEEFLLLELDEDAPGGGVSMTKFLGFEWLDPKWLVGEREVDGVKCVVYVAPWPLSAAGEVPPVQNPSGYVLAAIGKEDKLPRRLENPYLIRRYTMGTNDQMSIPAAVLELLSTFREHVREQRAVSYRFAE